MNDHDLNVVSGIGLAGIGGWLGWNCCAWMHPLLGAVVMAATFVAMPLILTDKY